MARQETETYVVLDAPLNPNYGGRHIALPINDHDEACAELVLLRARLVAYEAAIRDLSRWVDRQCDSHTASLKAEEDESYSASVIEHRLGVYEAVQSRLRNIERELLDARDEGGKVKSTTPG